MARGRKAVASAVRADPGRVFRQSRDREGAGQHRTLSVAAPKDRAYGDFSAGKTLFSSRSTNSVVRKPG